MRRRLSWLRVITVNLSHSSPPSSMIISDTVSQFVYSVREKRENYTLSTLIEKPAPASVLCKLCNWCKSVVENFARQYKLHELICIEFNVRYSLRYYVLHSQTNPPKISCVWASCTCHMFAAKSRACIARVFSELVFLMPYDLQLLRTYWCIRIFLLSCYTGADRFYLSAKLPLSRYSCLNCVRFCTREKFVSRRHETIKSMR